MAGRNVDFVNTIPGRCALSVNDPNSPAPQGWAWIKLTEIARLESGHTPSRNHPEYWDGDIAWIGIKDAREHHAGVIDDTLQHVTQAGIDNSAARLLPAKTVCLSRTASVGYVVVMGRPMATSQDFVNWVCTPALDPDYLKWLLLAEGGDGLRKFGKGSTHTTIYFPEVQAFHACVAPLNEQRRIVAKLDAIFEQTRAARARLERLPALLEKLKRSILAAAFRGDLTKDWRAANPNVEPASALLGRIRAERRRRWEEALRAKGKDPTKATYEEAPPPEVSELADLPPGWTWASIDEMATVFQYGSSAKTRDQEKVPVIRMGNIVDGQLVYDGFKYLPADHDEFPDLFLQPGDLLFNRTNSPELVGKSAVYDGRVTPCSFASYLIRVRFHLVDSRWVSHYLNSGAGRDWVRGVVAQQVGQANVNGTKLKAFVIPVPPADEVAAALRLIEAALDSARALEDQVDAVLNELADAERAVLAKAFRGELVPQDPNDEPAAVLLERIRATRNTEPTAPRRDRTAPRSEPAPTAAKATNDHAIAHREDPLDLVIAAFQQGEPRLGAAAITQATGLDAAAVKRTLSTLVDSGQVRVHGRARGMTYEWAT